LNVIFLNLLNYVLYIDILEFLDVGKLKPALEVLSDVLRSKKHRTWQKVHEPIIEQYLNLCVELRKSQAAKEGLYQYKIICQQVSDISICLNICFFKIAEINIKCNTQQPIL